MLLLRAKVGAQGQRVGVGAHGIVFHVLEEWLQCGRLLGQLLVIPGRGRIGGQCQLIRQVYAGIAGRKVDVGGEVEDLREQDYAVQVDVLAVLQNVGQNGGACGAVTLAKYVLWRVPAVVLGNEPGDEASKGIGVLIHPPEGLFRVLAGQPPKAGAGHVDEDQVAGVEQGVGVVNELVGRRGQVLVATGDHMLGAERTHMQPDGRTSRSAVKEEGNKAVLSLRVFLEVCDVKYTCDRSYIFWVFRRVEGQLAAGLRLAVQAQLRVLDVG